MKRLLLQAFDIGADSIRSDLDIAERNSSISQRHNHACIVAVGENNRKRIKENFVRSDIDEDSNVPFPVLANTSTNNHSVH